MKKVINKNLPQSKVSVIQMNNYVRPKSTALLQQSTSYITNGADNSFFQYVEDRYVGSPTNQAVIDGISNYIYGEGLIASGVDIYSIISRSDARLMVKDLKKQGAYALQIVYSKDRKSIAKMYFIPVKQLAIAQQPDITEEPQAYWYSFDWKLRSKFPPKKIPAFGLGNTDKKLGEIDYEEILYVKIPSAEPLFALPDYVSGLQAAETEEEMSNYCITYIKNNFSAGKVINVNQGVPENDEAQEEAERAILGKTKGTSNAGNIIISFNNNKENETTVNTIEITNAYEQFEWLSVNCRDKILMSHKINDPGLFGIITGTGFSSTADQMAMSLKILYRNQINPLREIILDGLERALKYNNPDVKIDFKDFSEEKLDTTKNTDNPGLVQEEGVKTLNNKAL